jgi:hypothetical protein
LKLLTWLGRWTLDAPILLASCVLLLDPAVRLRADWTPPTRILRLVLAGISAITLIAGFLIPAWATGGVVAGRLLDFLYLIFLTTVLVSVLLWKAARKTGIAVNLRLRSAITVALFAAMFAAGNPWLGAADLASRIPQWAASRRVALGNFESRGRDGGPATFPTLPPYPHLYFDYDITNDPGAYPNRCVARYYGLDSIVGSRATEWPDGAALSGRTRGSR